MTDFAFNVDLDKSLFTVDAPDGYVVRNAEINQSLPQEKVYSDNFFSPWRQLDFPMREIEAR